MAESTCPKSHDHLILAAYTVPGRSEEKGVRSDRSRVREEVRSNRVGCLEGREGALAATVAEDAVEVQGVEIACHRSFCRPRRRTTEEKDEEAKSRIGWWFTGWLARGVLLSASSTALRRPVFNMADDGKEEKVSSRGADWEVVSLTASAYAAEPGLQEFDPTSERKEKENMTERASSAALFVSGHFVFPPSEHENLRVDPDTSKIHGEPTMIGGDNGIDDSGREKLQTESDDDQYGIEFSEGNRISFRDMGFEEGKGSHRLNLVGVEQDIFADPHSVDTHSEAHKSSTKSEAEEPSDVNMESPHDHAKPGVGEIDGSNLPCQAWWKKHAVSLYKQAKEAGTFWPVVVAAAVMGIIIVGQRWHQDKWRFSINNEVCLLPL
ncbi:hypothetical protein BHM03_00020854 [Ensete ventricosum]|nr:hypothetical protein BHM03_00020854 [Ensete ventricosum]